MTRDIKELTLTQLEELLKNWGQPRFYAQEIFSWIFKKQEDDFSRMTNLPLSLREKLKENFCLSSIKLLQSLRSSDGTEKFLFEMEDENLVEAVAIPAPGRLTGCISSQVGCKYGCSFCASAIGGFKRNLTCAEILDQALYIRDHSSIPLTHLVFMGMGEPMDNYANLMQAIRLINASFGLQIGARRITVSTCGVVPGIESLSREKLQVELSISLHAAVDDLRSKLVPCNKKYPLKALIRACQEYTRVTKRQITFEYILIKGVNSDLQNAKNASRIIKSVPLAKVNLIPANCIKEQGIAPPSGLEIRLFKERLEKSGITVTLRQPRGQDIGAACGQLRSRYEKK